MRERSDSWKTKWARGTLVRIIWFFDAHLKNFQIALQVYSKNKFKCILLLHNPSTKSHSLLMVAPTQNLVWCFQNILMPYIHSYVDIMFIKYNHTNSIYMDVHIHAFTLWFSFWWSFRLLNVLKNTPLGICLNIFRIHIPRSVIASSKDTS